MLEVCRTCSAWGPESAVSDEDLKAWAVCHQSELSHMFKSRQDWTCPYWKELYGEPLGVGLSRFWLLSEHHRFLPAAIVHDFMDVPGCNRHYIDTVFLHNCLKLSRNWREKVLAYTLYGICRAYSQLK